MYNCCRFLLISFIPLFLFSCKNETKEISSEDTSVKVDTISAAEQRTLTEERKEQAKSVLSKIVVTPELNSYVRKLVTTGTAEELLKGKGPYTVFAPSDEAFEKMDEGQKEFMASQKNMESITGLMKIHIAKGSYDTATLVQKIKESGGKYSITTILGDTLMVSRKGDRIIVQNMKGVKGTIGKSDIVGSNGVLHVLDAILFMN